MILTEKIIITLLLLRLLYSFLITPESIMLVKATITYAALFLSLSFCYSWTHLTSTVGNTSLEPALEAPDRRRVE